jgi:hypothetical protein
VRAVVIAARGAEELRGAAVSHARGADVAERMRRAAVWAGAIAAWALKNCAAAVSHARGPRR